MGLSKVSIGLQGELQDDTHPFLHISLSESALRRDHGLLLAEIYKRTYPTVALRKRCFARDDFDGSRRCTPCTADSRDLEHFA